MMADTDAEKAARKAELAEAFKDGMLAFRAHVEEETAKAEAAKAGDKTGDADAKPKRSIAEWLMG